MSQHRLLTGIHPSPCDGEHRLIANIPSSPEGPAFRERQPEQSPGGMLMEIIGLLRQIALELVRRFTRKTPDVRQQLSQMRGYGVNLAAALRNSQPFQHFAPQMDPRFFGPFMQTQCQYRMNQCRYISYAQFCMLQAQQQKPKPKTRGHYLSPDAFGVRRFVREKLNPQTGEYEEVAHRYAEMSQGNLWIGESTGDPHMDRMLKREGVVVARNNLDAPGTEPTTFGRPPRVPETRWERNMNSAIALNVADPNPYYRQRMVREAASWAPVITKLEDIQNARKYMKDNFGSQFPPYYEAQSGEAAWNRDFHRGPGGPILDDYQRWQG